MPLRKIHHPVGAYTAEERKEFAEAITRVYQAVPIRRFYAVIIRPAGGPDDGTGTGKTTPCGGRPRRPARA